MYFGFWYYFKNMLSANYLPMTYKTDTYGAHSFEYVTVVNTKK